MKPFPWPLGYGIFSLLSPGGLHYSVQAADDGAWIVYLTPVAIGRPYFHLGNFRYAVADDGAIIPIPLQSIRSPWYFGEAKRGFSRWYMVSLPSKNLYMFTAAADGAVIPTLIPMGFSVDGEMPLGNTFILDEQGKPILDESGNPIEQE